MLGQGAKEMEPKSLAASFWLSHICSHMKYECSYGQWLTLFEYQQWASLRELLCSQRCGHYRPRVASSAYRSAVHQLFGLLEAVLEAVSEAAPSAACLT